MKKTFNENRTRTYSFENGVTFSGAEVWNEVSGGATCPGSFTPVKRQDRVIELFELFMKGKGYLDETKFNSFLRAFKLEIEAQERLFSREEIVKKLGKIREVCAESPFVERAQRWPRGYQGDFETIDYIIKGMNKAKEGTFAYVYENLLLQGDICQQHRNKIQRQAELIKEAILRKRDAKIISVGCGTSEDMKRCIPDIQNSEAEITLVDVDQDALNFSLHQLDTIKERVTVVAGNIYRVMRALTEKYDLILIGGVFDYLNDKTIVSVLSSLRNNLTENGKLFFTNIDKNNPYRVFMEYTGDWTLIERSKTDVMKLITQAGWAETSSSIYKDKTNLTHLVELKQPG